MRATFQFISYGIESVHMRATFTLISYGIESVHMSATFQLILYGIESVHMRATFTLMSYGIESVHMRATFTLISYGIESVHMRATFQLILYGIESVHMRATFQLISYGIESVHMRATFKLISYGIESVHMRATFTLISYGIESVHMRATFTLISYGIESVHMRATFKLISYGIESVHMRATFTLISYGIESVHMRATFKVCDVSRLSVKVIEKVMVDQFLNEEQTAAILKILMLGVTPAISTFGVIGNIFSVIVLVKRGLKRSSNILLLSLAVQDISFLVGFNSVPKLLYEIVGSTEGFVYNRDTSYALFGLYQLFIVLDYGCGAISLPLPVLITIERLVAVFLPLKFHQIVTSRRTWTAVIVVSVFWYGFFIHMTFYVVLDFEIDQNLNLTVGVMRRSKYHSQNPMAVLILEDAMSYLFMKIPPIITFVECITIGIKIKMSSTERMKMTSEIGRGKLSTRTTKMLMAVCTVYTVTCTTLCLPTFIPQYMYYSITNDAPSNMGRVLYQAINIVLCVNSSCNFVIYVVMNKNFRTTYWSLVTRRSETLVNEEHVLEDGQDDDRCSGPPGRDNLLKPHRRGTRGKLSSP
ncbi:hypothetical protein Btru_058261 [Bulinus truncatus]|nr:hypothetical protein Btru_058261 [Bulinus truncatus]